MGSKNYQFYTICLWVVFSLSACQNLPENQRKNVTIDAVIDYIIPPNEDTPPTSKKDDLAADNNETTPRATTITTLSADEDIITPIISRRPPPIQPSDFIGKNLSVLEDQLGEADLRRFEGKYQIWQYQQASCVIDFFIPYKINIDISQINQQISDFYIRARQIDQSVKLQKCIDELNQNHIKTIKN